MIVNCTNCKRKVTHQQLCRLVWKKQNKFKDVCPYCVKEYMANQIKEVDLDKKILKPLEVTNKDIKEELKQWNKNHYETF